MWCNSKHIQQFPAKDQKHLNDGMIPSDTSDVEEEEKPRDVILATIIVIDARAYEVMTTAMEFSHKQEETAQCVFEGV